MRLMRVTNKNYSIAGYSSVLKWVLAMRVWWLSVVVVCVMIVLLCCELKDCVRRLEEVFLLKCSAVHETVVNCPIITYPFI